VDYTAMPYAVFASPQVAGVGDGEQGSASISLGLFDNIAGFELSDGRGFVPAFIETDDGAALE
jgi:pyruvate/2-oxoglutarate dehydrogenase complex dihydrolipoamide dehydrogenase (E3) component